MNKFDKYILKTNKEIQSKTLTEAEGLDAIKNFLNATSYIARGSKGFEATGGKKAEVANEFILVNGTTGLQKLKALATKAAKTATPTPTIDINNGKIINKQGYMVYLYNSFYQASRWNPKTPGITPTQLAEQEINRHRVTRLKTELPIVDTLRDETIKFLKEYGLQNEIKLMTQKDAQSFRDEKEKGGVIKRAGEWGAKKIVQGAEGIKTDIKAGYQTLTPTSF